MANINTYTNNAVTTLAAGITAGAVSLSVAAGAGALFPVLSGALQFFCTLVDGSGNIEIVKVTARAADVFTIVRAQEGTTARAFSTGDKVELRVTAANAGNWEGKAEAGANADITSLTGLTTPVALIPTILGAFRNLLISSIGISNYNSVITIDEVILEDSSNRYVIRRAVNLTINANGMVGAPLSIMSARAASTWYYIWLWYNVANGITATLDVSSSAPTAPTGYVSTDYKALMPGERRTDASVNKYLLQMKTQDNDTQYIVLAASNTPNTPLMAGGTNTFPVAVAISNFVPPTAKRIRGYGGDGSGGSVVVLVAPNNQYGNAGNSTNPPPVQFNTVTTTMSIPFDFIIESTNIYYGASSAASYVNCLGWRS